MCCDFCGEGHENEVCVPQGVSEEAQFANFQNGFQQAPQVPFYINKSPLEETLDKFIKMTQSGFDLEKEKH